MLAPPNFHSSVYYAGGFDGIATNCQIGQPMVRNIRRHSLSKSTTLEQPSRDDKRSKLGAKISSFFKSLFHQTRCEPQSTKTHLSQVPEPLKRSPPRCPKIPIKELRSHDSCRNDINGPWLVHPAKLSNKSAPEFDHFVEYTRVENKDADEFWKEVLSSIEESRSFRKVGDLVEHDNGYCDQRFSFCSSELFELENYKL